MTTTLKKTVPHEVEIELGGVEVAGLFWNLDAREQAEFFNYLGSCYGLVFQLQAVTDSDNLKGCGRAAMSRIGEYSAPSKA